MTIRYRRYKDYVEETRRRTTHSFMLYGKRGGDFTPIAPIQRAFDAIEGYEPVTRPSLERICGKIQERCYPEEQLKTGLKEARCVATEVFDAARGNMPYNIGHLTFNDLYRLAINGEGRCADSNHFVHDMQIGIGRYLRGDFGTVYNDRGVRRAIFSVPIAVGPQEEPPEEDPVSNDEEDTTSKGKRSISTTRQWSRVGDRLNRDRPVGERKFLERNTPKELSP